LINLLFDIGMRWLTWQGIIAACLDDDMD